MGFSLPLALLDGHHDTAQALRGLCHRGDPEVPMLSGYKDVFMEETKLRALE